MAAMSFGYLIGEKVNIFELYDKNKPIILRFLGVAGINDTEELIIAETTISKVENHLLYERVISFFHEFGLYVNRSSYIEGVTYYECDIEHPCSNAYQQLFGIFILNFGSELFIRIVRDLKDGVRKPVLRLYLPQQNHPIY